MKEKLPPVVTNDENSQDSEAEFGLAAFHAVASTVRFRKLRKKRLKRNPGVKAFERRYTELGPALIPEQKRIDYVLVHKNKYSSEVTDDEDKKEEMERKETKRARFEKCLLNEGFDITKEVIGDHVFVKLHCPFKRLCAEAEIVKLEMPLSGCANYPEPKLNCITKFIEDHLETDNEMDYVSAPFLMDRINLYNGYEDPTHFFRPAQRSLLVNHILINIDIRTKEDKKNQEEIKVKDENPDEESRMCSTYCGCLPCTSKPDPEKEIGGVESKVVINETDAMNEKYYIPGKIHSLPYLLMKGVYSDSFILHEESEVKDDQNILKDKFFTQQTVDLGNDTAEEHFEFDPRRDLNNTWTVFWKYQPLWKIRNYFGEMIAFYFAWVGEMTSSLWIPTLFGFAIFLYGLVLSVESNKDDFTIPENATTSEAIRIEVQALLDVIRMSFDNEVTPYFALIICLWGTLFLENWKRKNARLAYEWDVDNYEQNEPDRPQFYGLKVKKDPVTQEQNWFYPVKRQFLKYFVSGSTLLFMVFLVLMSVTGVIIYRVIITIDFCPGMNAVECLITSTIISSVLNAVSILLLGKIYEKLAFYLTDWENHRTQTQYDDALITKMFAFQFVNSYASCFYIAFFRGRIPVFGYTDECSGDTGTCMSQLSFQVLVLMVIRPFPRILKDLIIPLIRKLWRIRPNWCCRCGVCPCDCCNKINKVSTDEARDHFEADRKLLSHFLERERLKPPLGDFTLNEFTEKVIQYGFLMLFAASFPLAPLMALLLNLVDIRIDARRMLWSNRRPLAYIRQGIGKWYGILEMVNVLGVISNGFLIGFTSSWSSSFSIATKLWIVIGFEHIVFATKFVIAYLIPDVPRDVRLAIRREKFQVARIIENSKGSEIIDYSVLVPNHSQKKRRQRSSNYDTFVQLDNSVGQPDSKDGKTIPEGKEPQETDSLNMSKNTADFNRPSSARTGGNLSLSGVVPQVKTGNQTTETVV